MATNTTIPVSYTHLDVYKRQGQLRPATRLWGTLGGLALVHGVVALGRGDLSPVLWGLSLVLWAEIGLSLIHI